MTINNLCKEFIGLAMDQTSEPCSQVVTGLGTNLFESQLKFHKTQVYKLVISITTKTELSQKM